jgi:hypothetical protein
MEKIEFSSTRFSIEVIDSAKSKTINDLQTGDVFSYDNGESWYLVTTSGISYSVAICPSNIVGYTSEMLFGCQKSLKVIIADKVTIKIDR